MVVNALDPFFEVDSEGRMTEWNARAAQAFEVVA